MKPTKVIFILTACLLLGLNMNAQQLSLTASDFNGYNISCFGMNNGYIDLEITGGTAPYTIRWSNDETTEDLADLPAGYYSVEVDDADSTTLPVTAEITLTEPREIKVEVFIHSYNDKYNISVYGACNGIVSFQTLEGISPYTYAWSDDTTLNTNSRTNLCADKYKFRIIDANGCKYLSEAITLTEPERSDWQMNGNENTDPISHFIGTLDSIDFVFRTNGIERLRLGADGTINFDANLNVGNIINFSNNKVIDYRAATATEPEIMSFGKLADPSTFSLATCLSPYIPGQTAFQFNGLLQLYAQAAGGNINLLQMGFDGANSVIDAMGNSTDPIGNRLLINYNCGKDVFVGNSTLGGNLTANCDFFTLGSAGLGTTDADGYRLNVNGDINFSGDLFHDGQSISIGDWNNNANGIDYPNYVGIGTSLPMELLQIGDRFTFHNGGNKAVAYNFTFDGTNDKRIVDGASAAMYLTANGEINFRVAESDVANSNIVWTNALQVRNDGYVLIGNPSFDSDYLLSVCGGVKAKKVRIPSNWCDFVFDSKYDLMPLDKLESFITLNKHLPGIPTQKQVETDGLDVAEILELQMEKIEELTLYVIQLQKQIDCLNK